MSAFEKWFIEQHGGRPCPEAGRDHQLRERITDGRLAQSILDQRNEWDARRESALYAWQARDGQQHSEQQHD